MMIQKFTFDVMSDEGRFICTTRMPLGLGSIIDYEGDKPVIRWRDEWKLEDLR